MVANERDLKPQFLKTNYNESRVMEEVPPDYVLALFKFVFYFSFLELFVMKFLVSTVAGPSMLHLQSQMVGGTCTLVGR